MCVDYYQPRHHPVLYWFALGVLGFSIFSIALKKEIEAEHRFARTETDKRRHVCTLEKLSVSDNTSLEQRDNIYRVHDIMELACFFNCNIPNCSGFLKEWDAADARTIRRLSEMYCQQGQSVVVWDHSKNPGVDIPILNATRPKTTLVKKRTEPVGTFWSTTNFIFWVIWAPMMLIIFALVYT